MKKTILALSLVTLLAACGGASTEVATDSAATVSTDTTAVVADSTTQTVDSTTVK